MLFCMLHAVLVCLQEIGFSRLSWVPRSSPRSFFTQYIQWSCFFCRLKHRRVWFAYIALHIATSIGCLCVICFIDNTYCCTPGYHVVLYVYTMFFFSEYALGAPKEVSLYVGPAGACCYCCSLQNTISRQNIICVSYQTKHAPGAPFCLAALWKHNPSSFLTKPNSS